MQECLVQICKEFESIKEFLTEPTKQKEDQINTIFEEFMECFTNLKAEKLEYPNEFIADVKLYMQDDQMIHKKFSDVQMRYLMLSDFYDYARLTKKYKKQI